MRGIGGDVGDRQAANVVERHRAVTVEALVLGRDLAGAILELPRRIGQDRAKPLPPRAGEEIDVRLERIDRGEHNRIFVG